MDTWQRGSQDLPLLQKYSSDSHNKLKRKRSPDTTQTSDLCLDTSKAAHPLPQRLFDGLSRYSEVHLEAAQGRFVPLGMTAWQVSSSARFEELQHIVTDSKGSPALARLCPCSHPCSPVRVETTRLGLLLPLPPRGSRVCPGEGSPAQPGTRGLGHTQHDPSIQGTAF